MAETPAENQPETPKKKGYGHRPMWQWILLYVIIGAIVYLGIYYFMANRNSSDSGGSSTTNSLY